MKQAFSFLKGEEDENPTDYWVSSYQEHFSGHSELDSIYIHTKVYLGRLGS